MCRGTKTILVLLGVLFITTPFLHATNAAQNDSTIHKKFDTSALIMSHIGDAYEWHIATVGEKHIAIPLPIILYSTKSGFQFFISSEFHHGKSEYNGFYVASKGNYKGKIVELNSKNEEVRPFDISITKNVVALLVSVLLLIVLFSLIAKRYKTHALQSPKGLQSFIEPIILFVRDDIARSSIGSKESEKYLPYLLTIFFFILINNLLGLVPIFPGGANLTGNIAIAMVLAVATFIITSWSGTKTYWIHAINMPGVPWWLKFPLPLMAIVEITGIFSKPFVLMVRLFANITAGHIIVLGFYSLIFIFGEKSVYLGYGVSIMSIAFTVFMGLLELLVAFLQAYVFTLLSALYIGAALIKPHHNSDH